MSDYQSVRSAKCEERLKFWTTCRFRERHWGLICTPSDEKKNRERRARKKSRRVGEKRLTFLLLTWRNLFISTFTLWMKSPLINEGMQTCLIVYNMDLFVIEFWKMTPLRAGFQMARKMFICFQLILEINCRFFIFWWKKQRSCHILLNM